MTIKEYNFEIYTKHPETKEGGWDIKFASTFATNTDEARQLFRDSYPLFDSFISLNFRDVELGEQELQLFNSGVTFFDRHSYMNNDIVTTYNLITKEIKHIIS